MKIADILSPERVITEITAGSKREILRELARPVSRDLHLDLDELVEVLAAREALGSTGIGDGVAIPHGKVQELRDIVAVLGRSTRGLDFDAIDKKPCHIFFMLLAPSNSASQHLKALARASTLLKDPGLRQGILESSSSAEMYNLVVERDSGIED